MRFCSLESPKLHHIQEGATPKREGKSPGIKVISKLFETTKLSLWLEPKRYSLCEQLPEPPKCVTLPRRERLYTQMSQELWEMVIEYLPSLTGRHAAQVFNFELTERHQKHSDIWNQILKDKETWTSIVTRQGLNPVLIGDGLHSLWRDPMQPAYIALSTGDKSWDIRYDRTKLLTSLRAYHWNKDNEIVFDESKITLNINEALYSPFIVTLATERLFSSQHGRLRSASLYWKVNMHFGRLDLKISLALESGLLLYRMCLLYVPLP